MGKTRMSLTSVGRPPRALAPPSESSADFVDETDSERDLQEIFLVQTVSSR